MHDLLPSFLRAHLVLPSLWHLSDHIMIQVSSLKEQETNLARKKEKEKETFFIGLVILAHHVIRRVAGAVSSHDTP